MSVASFQEVSVAELAEVNGGFLLLLVGLAAMVATAKGMQGCGPK
jgi:lactobin A/cerein 7B family class IIb bacteriocin